MIGKVESGWREAGSVCPGIVAVYDMDALSMSDVSMPEPGLHRKRSANRERAPWAGAGVGASDSGLPGPPGRGGLGWAEGVRPSSVTCSSLFPLAEHSSLGTEGIALRWRGPLNLDAARV